MTPFSPPQKQQRPQISMLLDSKSRDSAHVVDAQPAATRKHPLMNTHPPRVLCINNDPLSSRNMAEKNEKKPEETPAPAAAPEKKKLPQLAALEDDDEFEVS